MWVSLIKFVVLIPNILLLQPLKMLSLSISDGRSTDDPFDPAPSVIDTSLWFPSLPGQDLSILGMDGKGRWHYNRGTPITIAMLDTSHQDFENISGITVAHENENFYCLEVCYPAGITPVKLGVDGIIQPDVSSFTIDHANGERIRGIESFYMRGSEFLGFKVYKHFKPLASKTLPLQISGIDVKDVLGVHEQGSCRRDFTRPPRRCA